MKQLKGVVGVMLEVIALVFISEALFWLTSDYIIYNEKFVETVFSPLFLFLPFGIMLFLYALLHKIRKKRLSFLQRLLIVLIFIYMAHGLLIISIESYCNALPISHSFWSKLLILILIFYVGFMQLRFIVPILNRRRFFILLIGVLLLIADLLYFHLGYGIFDKM